MGTNLPRAVRLIAFLFVLLCTLDRTAPAQTLPTVIYANPAVGYAGQTISLVASLWSNGSRLSGKSLTFTKGASTLGSAITDGVGVARLTYTIPAGTATGGYTITASFAGDTSYLPGSRSFTLTVKLPSITYTNAASGYAGQTITLVASLKSGGAGLSAKTLTFAQGASVLGSAPTDSNGIARLLYTIPAGTATGSYTVNASFAGNATYLPSSRNLTLTVKLATILYTNPATGSPGQMVALVASLWANGARLANKTLIYTASGTVLGTAQTDSNGIARLNYTIPAGIAGATYTVPVSFAGDASYLPNSRNLALSVPVPTATRFYVSSFNTNDVKAYDCATGNFLGNFISSGAGGVSGPHKILFRTDGYVYLSSHFTQGVLRFRADTGAFVDAFVPSGSGGMDNAVGMVFDKDGDLLVCSALTDEVKRYDGKTGAFIDNFIFGPDLRVPINVVSGIDGALYICSVLTDEIKRYDGATGTFVDNFVIAGSGGLKEPDDLVFGPDGNLYVTSYATDEVKRYSGMTGAFMDNFVPFQYGGLSRPVGMAFGPDGNLYVISEGTDSVKRYAGRTGAYLGDADPSRTAGLSRPWGITFH